LGNKIPFEIKEERTKRLRLLGYQKKQNHLSRFVGIPLHVLVENRNAPSSGNMTGLSENYLRVDVSGPENIKGEIVVVVPENMMDGKLTAVFKINAVCSKRS
jgi:tRNA A37 methylthiotransferase MiaB